MLYKFALHKKKKLFKNLFLQIAYNEFIYEDRWDTIDILKYVVINRLYCGNNKVEIISTL